MDGARREASTCLWSGGSVANCARMASRSGVTAGEELTPDAAGRVVRGAGATPGATGLSCAPEVPRFVVSCAGTGRSSVP